MERIRLCDPGLGEAELDRLRPILVSGMLVQGAVVARFEAAVAERVGRAYAIAVSSGTAALELVLEALDVGGGEVVVPALTWPSPAHAARRAGAEVAVVDVDPQEWNATPAALAAAIGEETRAIVAIDQFGAPARLTELTRLVEGRVPIVEDAACAIGSTLAGRPCGSFGIASCLSFHPRKVLTTGEGGMVLTDDAALAARVRQLRNHGQSSPGVFAEPGPNLRLGELAAALGLAQLERLDATLARRRALADRMRERLAQEGVLGDTQRAAPGACANEQTFGVRLPPGTDRDAVVAALHAADIEAGRLSYALHRLGSLAAARRPVAGLPVTEALVDRGLALPLHAMMSDADADRVVMELARALATSS